MRPRFGILALVFLTLVSACGGSSSPSASSSPTAPSTRLGSSTPTKALTEVTVACDKFAGVAQKIAEAETKLYSGSSSLDTLGALLAELTTLKDGAPSDVKAALDDLGNAFRAAQDQVSAPTQAGADQLKALAPKLSADGQKITAYVISKCTG